MIANDDRDERIRSINLMKIGNHPRNWLFGLLIINVVSTILHYTDNFIFFNRYSAPSWMNMHHVYLAWLVLTPFAIVGYIFYTRQKYWLAYLCLFCLFTRILVQPVWGIIFMVQ